MKIKYLAIAGSILLLSNGVVVQAASVAAQPGTVTEATAGTGTGIAVTETITRAADLSALSEAQRVEKIGLMCQQDYKKTGVLASISAAQCILESGYLTTDLAVEANNCFGMKVVLSGNTWNGSAWDGLSSYTKQTQEEYNGQKVMITADFRSYDKVEDSLEDHSSYLLGAMNGSQLRYAGLKGETDYKKAVQIIKDGGYATDSSYVDKICSIIERFNLTQYDNVEYTGGTSVASSVIQQPNVNASAMKYDDKYYRVRKSWSDSQSQIGAYYVLDNAKKACTSGYSIYDPKGNVVFTK